MKRTIGNVLATGLALLVGLATIWATRHFLKDAQNALDWLVLILSGVMTGTIVFFVVWGHFQDEPASQ